MRCEKCREFVYTSLKHKCPPRWHVYLPEWMDEDEADLVYGSTAERAAEEYCERFDSDGDYCVIQQGEATAMVKPEGGGEWREFAVGAESVPNYTAFEPLRRQCT